MCLGLGFQALFYYIIEKEMKKRRIRLVVLRTLKRMGWLCKPEVKDPYVRVSSVTYPDGTRKEFTDRIHKDKVINENSLESEIHVWKELKKQVKNIK